MEKKKLLTLLNILLIVAMVVHIGIKMYLHGQQVEYSAPVYVELVNAVYYLLPLVVINVIGFITRKH
jgi:flagellar basal body-associated protein FliL